MKKTILITLSILAAAVLLFAAMNWNSTRNYLGWDRHEENGTSPVAKTPIAVLEKIERTATALTLFAKERGFDTNHFFIIDMRQASGKERFYVYNGRQKKIVGKALVTHGRCNESALKGRRYSNVVGGGCTSLGRYKIGRAYQGKFGLAYKLHGLDDSNNNAFERFIVLHAHSCVPNGEVHPYPICQSDGCPTVSPAFLQTLARIIDASKKPVLMEIFDEDF